MLGLQQKPVAAGSHGAEVFPPAHRELPESDLFRLPQGVPDHPAGILREVVRQNVMGSVVGEGRYLAGLHELDELEGPFRLEPDRADLHGVEKKEFIVADLVPFRMSEVSTGPIPGTIF